MAWAKSGSSVCHAELKHEHEFITLGNFFRLVTNNELSSAQLQKKSFALLELSMIA